jgi:hypothetical protein
LEGVRWVVLVCLLAGCDVVIGLDKREAVTIDARVFDAENCPTEFKSIASGQTSRYLFVQNMADYVTHAGMCLNQSAGLTHLLAIETSAEGVAIDKQLDLLNTNRYFFVGLEQLGDPDRPDAGWKWITGTDLDPAMWGANEPRDNLDGIENHEEDRGITSQFGTHADLLDAAAIDPSLFAICECDGIDLR